MKIKVNVKKKHIQACKNGYSSTSCPIALAIKDLGFRSADIIPNSTCIVNGFEKIFNFQLTKKANKFINKIDDSKDDHFKPDIKSVKPTSFTFKLEQI